MHDCPNAEIRDQLPDLIHERLEMSVRVVVVAHVAGCTDCQEELALLRSVREALAAQAPRVDVAFVVNALPKPPRVTVRERPVRRWADWRIAAAVTFLAVGGSSIALVTHANRADFTDSSLGRNVANAASSATNVGVTPRSTTPAATVGQPVGQPTATMSSPSATSVAPPSDADAEGVVDARLSGLTAGQLKALLGEIDQLEALPVTEPEPVSIRVNTGTPSTPEGAW
jgi:hypothetical protein